MSAASASAAALGDFDEKSQLEVEQQQQQSTDVDSGPAISVLIRQLTGDLIAIECFLSNTIFQVKEKLCGFLNSEAPETMLQPTQFSFTKSEPELLQDNDSPGSDEAIEAVILRDSSTLDSCGLEDGSMLFMFIDSLRIPDWMRLLAHQTIGKGIRVSASRRHVEVRPRIAPEQYVWHLRKSIKESGVAYSCYHLPFDRISTWAIDVSKYFGAAHIGVIRHPVTPNEWANTFHGCKFNAENRDLFNISVISPELPPHSDNWRSEKEFTLLFLYDPAHKLMKVSHAQLNQTTFVPIQEQAVSLAIIVAATKNNGLMTIRALSAEEDSLVR